MPHTAEFLLSAEAAEARAIRASAYPIPGLTMGNLARLSHVVWAEVMPYQFEELDAESEEHARNLAQAWVDNGTAIAASIRALGLDGSIDNAPITIISPDWAYDYEEISAP